MTALFLGILALLPLLVDVSAIRPFEPPKIIVFEIAVAVCAAAFLFTRVFKQRTRKKETLRVGALDLAVVAWFGGLALATAVSIAPDLSFFGSDERRMGLLFLFALIIMFLCVRATVRGDQWRTFWMVSLSVATGIALYGIAQWFGWDVSSFQLAFPVYGSSGAERAFGTLGHPNFLGAYLAMLLPFVLLVRKLWLRIGIVTIMSVAILFTYSRAAWAAALIGGTVAFLALEAGRARRWIVRLVAAGALTVFALVIFRPLLLASQNSVLFRLGTMTDVSEGSLRVRLDEWRFGASRMLSRPVLGFGLETYSLISVARVKDIHEAAHGAPGPDPTVADRLHNLWLDTIWSGGFTTLVLLLLILGLAFTRLSRWLQRSKDRSEAAALLGALIAWLVANQAGFDCSITAIFWMLLLARIASAEVLL